MYHALFFTFSSINTITDKAKKTILLLVQLGVLFFSGSIYTCTKLSSFDFKVMVLTPIGGLLIAAWAVLLYQNWKKML
jgi:uncharacterized membrane protein YgdD (TMEM256/DUF423 family)